MTDQPMTPTEAADPWLPMPVERAIERLERSTAADTISEHRHAVITLQNFARAQLARATAAPGDLAARLNRYQSAIERVLDERKVSVDAETLYALAEATHRCAPAVEVATDEPEWQRVARTAEPYDAAIDLGVPVNATNGKAGTVDNRPAAAPAEDEAANGDLRRWIADQVVDLIGGDFALADVIGDALADDLAALRDATPPGNGGVS